MSGGSHPGRPEASHAREIAARTHFDRWRDLYALGPLASLQRESLRALSLRSDDAFLDVACGMGAAVRSAGRVARRAVGIDLSPESIRAARDSTRGVEEVSFEVAESDRLPFEDGVFTAVLCTTALHHFPDRRASVAEAHRVLAPGGRIVAADLCADRFTVRALDALLRRIERGHVGFLRASEIEDSLSNAGFAKPAVRYLRWRQYAVLAAVKPAG